LWLGCRVGHSRCYTGGDTMKPCLVLLLLVSFAVAVVASDLDPLMTATTNGPTLPVPDGWDYASPPSVWFWSGFKVGMAMLVFPISVGVMRKVTGGPGCE